MKRLLLGTVALLALASSALVASADTTSMNWTGIYVGVNSGFQSSNANYTFDYDGSGGCSVDSAICNVFAPYTGGTFGQHVSGSGIGGQIAFNMQAPTSHWVLSMEGSFGQPNLIVQAENVFGTGRVNPTATYETALRSLITVTPRVGYVSGDALIFVKGGLAVAHEATSLSQSSTVEGCPCSFRSSHNFAGYTLGVGADWAFHPGWSAGIEYDYAKFDSQHFGGATPATIGFTTTWATGYMVNPNISSVLIRLNYKI